MRIVDAQVHIWSGAKPANPNHRQVASFTKDDLLKEMDAAGVDAAVIHPPTSWDPNANELAIEAARHHPDRRAILGNFPLDRPESRALIDGWKRRPGMLGLRFTFLQPHQRTWADGRNDGLAVAGRRARQTARRPPRGQFSAGRRPGRRTTSGAPVDRRSPRQIVR